MSRTIHALAVSLAVIAAGCSSRGYQTGESAATAARNTKSSISSYSERTQAVLGSMGSLFKEPYQDLPTKYEAFRKDVDTLGISSSNLSSSVTSLKSSVDARFKAWDQENANLTSREVRMHSEERREQVFESWQQAQAPLEAGVARTKALATQFDDLKKLLANDLTPKGVESASGLADKARSEAEKIVDASKSWMEKLDGAIEALSTGPTSPPPAPAPAPASK
jgi:hypothetical protein